MNDFGQEKDHLSHLIKLRTLLATDVVKVRTLLETDVVKMRTLLETDVVKVRLVRVDKDRKHFDVYGKVVAVASIRLHSTL